MEHENVTRQSPFWGIIPTRNVYETGPVTPKYRGRHRINTLLRGGAQIVNFMVLHLMQYTSDPDPRTDTKGPVYGDGYRETSSD